MKSALLPGFAILAILFLAATPFAAESNENEDLEQTSTDYAQAVEAVNSKKFQKAISYLSDVLQVKPSDANALNYLGYSYRKLGKYDKAIMYYKRALREKPDHLGANEYLGEAYLETGKLALAEQHLTRLKSACGNCEEYQDLKKDIAAYKAKR